MGRFPVFCHFRNCSGSVLLLKALHPFLLLYFCRDLIYSLTVRMWNSRGKGGLFAQLWPVLTPFVLLMIYYYAFGVVLNLRQGIGGVNYALFMFSGMALFNIFAESLQSGANSVISMPNFVKNATFPLQVLPFSTVGCALFSGLIYLGITIIAVAVTTGLTWRILLVFAVLIPYTLFCMGIALFSGAASVYFRDFPQLAVLLQQGLFFLTPIIYPAKIIPETCRGLIFANPLTGYVEALRSLLFGTPCPGFGWLWFNGFIVYILGFTFFHKTQKGFADVL